MATVSKLDYLKKYISSEEHGAQKKVKKKTKKVKSLKNIMVIDNDVKFNDNHRHDSDYENEFDLEEEKPQVYVDGHTLLSEHNEKIKQEGTNRWAPVPPRGLNASIVGHSKDGGYDDKNKHKRKQRGSSRDLSPERPTRSAVLLKRQRHDSEELSVGIEKRSSPDLSPPRGGKYTRNSDVLPNHKRSRKRHDSPDISPPRRGRRQASSDNSPHQDRTRGGSSDLSPERLIKKERSPVKSRKRHDSPDLSPERNVKRDTSPVRHRKRYDSPDLSPERLIKKERSPVKSRKRHDSPDLSPERKVKRDRSPVRHRKRYDSPDLSPERLIKKERSPVKSRKRHDSPDLSPERNVKRDRSPVRHRKAYNSSPPRSRRRHEIGSREEGKSRSPGYRQYEDQSKLSNQRTESSKRHKASPEIVTSGKKSGLQSAEALREENIQTKHLEDERFALMESSVSGKNATTVYRDKSGKKIDLALEKKKLDEAQRKKAEEDAKHDKLKKGLRQQVEYRKKLEDDIYEMAKPLARYEGDKDLDEMLKRQERDEDPMLDFIRKSKAKSKGKGKEKPCYKGPQPPPNRFNIWPGYRWDGVDRSNGFEKKRFAAIADRQSVSVDAYKWSVEDM